MVGDESTVVGDPIRRGLDSLLKNWWMVALRGLAAVLLGAFALARPDVGMVLLVAYFGAFALVYGIFSFAAAIRSAGQDRGWGWLIVEGALAVAAAVISFRMPQATVLSLTWLVAAWAIGTGILEVIGAIKLRKFIRGEFWLALSGILSVVFGVLAFARPAAGAIAIVTVLGVYAIFFGIVNLALGFRMAKARRELGTEAGERAAVR